MAFRLGTWERYGYELVDLRISADKGTVPRDKPRSSMETIQNFNKYKYGNS
jgi:hypothetical protein